MFDTYQPSGRIGVLTYGLLLLGLVLAGLLAFVYQLLLEWIPLIYVSFLFTLGFGFVLGVIGAFIVNTGRCRNVAFAALIGILLAITGLGSKFWFQYQHLKTVAVESIQADPEIPEEFRAEIVKQFKQEFTFVEHIKLRTDQGFHIGRGGGGGMPITGPFVYLIWLIEAGIVFYLAFVSPTSAAGEPYSEKMDAWADEPQVVMTLPITSPEMVSQIQSASSVDDLLEIPIPQTDESNQFAVYVVNSIPGEELEDAYLTVTSMTYSVNSKGEQETKEETLVRHAILPTEKRKQLIENAELLQEAMAEYRASLDEEEAAAMVKSELDDEDDN